MRLWTIQSDRVWHHMQQLGYLRTDPTQVEVYWIGAYQWLVGQMEKRIGSKPTEVALPVWAWYRWGGNERPIPDLRTGGHLQSGRKGVRLEIEIDAEFVLLSDFDLWHYPLNYWYLPNSMRDNENFDDELRVRNLPERHNWIEPITDPIYHQRILDSWERIFDLEWIDEENYTSNQNPEARSIQATFWELPMSAVKKVTEFTSR